MATPLSADKLLKAFRDEGLTVDEYPGWRTRERDAATGKPFGPVHGALIHHTAGTDSLTAVAKTGRPGLPAPLAHSHLAKSGLVTMCSAGRANHAGLAASNVMAALTAEKPLPKQDKSSTVDGNDQLYGLEIENLGNGKDPYPTAQYDAAVRWAAALCRAHGWGAGSVAGHKETSVEGKVDPSFPMGQFRTDVAERLKHPASWSPGDSDDNKEDDVALTTEDIKLLATKDGIWPAPKDAADYNADPAHPGHWWTLQSHITGTTAKVRSIEKSLADANRKIDTLTALVQTLVDAKTKES